MKKMNFNQMENLRGGQTVSTAVDNELDGDLSFRVPCFWAFPVTVAVGAIGVLGFPFSAIGIAASTAVGTNNGRCLTT
jgi:hypothetical protein